MFLTTLKIFRITGRVEEYSTNRESLTYSERIFVTYYIDS